MAAKFFGSTDGLTIVDGDLRAYIADDYNTGWMVDPSGTDTKLAALSSTDDTDLVAYVSPDLTAYADQAAADADGWTRGTGWTFDATNDEFDCDGTQTENSEVEYDSSTAIVAGFTYRITYDVSNYSAGNITFVEIGGARDGDNRQSDATYEATLTAINTGNLKFAGNLDFTGSIKNITVELLSLDRSVNANHLIVNGTVTVSEVASGSDLMGFSGLDASTYLLEESIAIGTGDFSIITWVKFVGTADYKTVAYWGDPASETGGRWLLRPITGGNMEFYSDTGSWGTPAKETTINVHDDEWHLLVVVKEGTTSNVYVDAVLGTSGVSPADLTNASADLHIGNRPGAPSENNTSTEISLFRFSDTAPTAAQIAKIYADELPLFQDKAACTLSDSGPAVTALAHDADLDLLYAGQDNIASVFDRLERIATSAVPTTTAIDAIGGASAFAGPTSVIAVSGGILSMPTDGVSFVQKGIMTYADEGLVTQGIFMVWDLDGSNSIYDYFKTDSGTGELVTRQIEGSVGVSVNSHISAYIPGTNVPFSVASYHTSSAINGAHEGTLLTANLTPTALPDLSSTDIQLWPKLMGYIDHWMMYNDNIEDAGVLEGSLF